MSALQSPNPKTLRALERKAGDIREEQRELESGQERPELEPLLSEGRSVLTSLQTLLPAFEAAMDRLALERLQRGQYKRLIQHMHDVQRPAKTPDVLGTSLFLFPLMLIEAALVVPVYIESGHAGWAGAIGFSLAFTFAVNGAGLIAGFLFLWYAFVRLRSPAPPQPFDWLKRLGAQFGFLNCLTAIGLVTFASLRTQALGPDALNIWDFDALGFWDTFAAPKATITLLIALIGATLAIYKGFGSFSDPVPHLSDATRYAEDDLTDTVDDLVASFDEEMADQADDFVERAEDVLGDVNECGRDRVLDASALRDQSYGFNQWLDREIAALRDRAARTARIRAEVRGRKPEESHDVDVSAFEALRLDVFDPDTIKPDPKTEKRVKKLRKLVAQVRAAVSDARARMRAAEAEFSSTSIDLDISPDVKG
ncbi:MAG: hypothetical protein ACQRW7_07295 [Caulobacterales bacterium]